jgi:hypothetical protein
VRTGGFGTRTDVFGTFHSTPVALGATTTDASGLLTFTFTVPDVPAGRHHLELTGLAPDGSTLQLAIPVDVVRQAPPPGPPPTVPAAPLPAAPATTAPVVPPPSPSPVRGAPPATAPFVAAPVGGLPRTGSSPASSLALALAFLAGGGVLAAIARRRWVT